MHSKGFERLAVSRFGEVLQSPIRYWLVPGTEQPASQELGLATLAQVGVPDPVPVFVEGEAASASSLGRPERVLPGSYGKVRVLTYAPEEIRMEVDAPSADFLVSTDRFASGWKAWVDGVPAPVIKTNFYFRGLLVPPGHHSILWRYQPALWVPLTLFAC